MSPSDAHAITTLDQLRTLYRQPSERVKAKKTDRIDAVTRRFIDASPFFLLATSAPDGTCDVSPRGGPAGQLLVLDDRRVAFPDLSGNNLLDSLTNLVMNPRAGLLVLRPGTDETLRIDGTVELSTAPELLQRWDEKVRRPKLAVVITVEHTFIHCAKAFRRGGVWAPDSWPEAADGPDPIEMFMEHTGTSGDVAALRVAADADYAAALADELPEEA